MAYYGLLRESSLYAIVTTETLDYLPLEENYTIPSGEVSTEVVISIIDDLRLEENETFLVTLVSNDPNTVIDTNNSTLEITIVDDGCKCISANRKLTSTLFHLI